MRIPDISRSAELVQEVRLAVNGTIRACWKIRVLLTCEVLGRSVGGCGLCGGIWFLPCPSPELQRIFNTEVRKNLAQPQLQVERPLLKLHINTEYESIPLSHPSRSDETSPSSPASNKVNTIALSGIEGPDYGPVVFLAASEVPQDIDATCSFQDRTIQTLFDRLHTRRVLKTKKARQMSCWCRKTSLQATEQDITTEENIQQSGRTHVFFARGRVPLQRHPFYYRHIPQSPAIRHPAIRTVPGTCSEQTVANFFLLLGLVRGLW